MVAFASAALAIAAMLLAGQNAYATHYPDSALCYDCHAVSKSNVLPGTKLIRNTPRVQTIITASPAWSGGNPLPCLFCHDAHAVSVTNSSILASNMVGVIPFFDAQSKSKHDVSLSSSTTDQADRLDCIDCHYAMNATSYVNNSGNSIHGVDARTGDYTWQTSMSLTSGATPFQTCETASCHSRTDNTRTIDTISIPRSHNNTYMVTINGGAAPSSCANCHGTHGSLGAGSLLTLRTDGTANYSVNQTGTFVTGNYVTAGNCGLCHNQDDGGAASPFETQGHGKASAYAGSSGYTGVLNFNCAACHDSGKPHDFFNRADMRLSMPDRTAGTLSTLSTGNSVESLCTNCHQSHESHVITGGRAACLDCHDPHGQNVGTNIMMLRTKVPKDTNADKYYTAADTVLDTINYTVSGSRDAGPVFDFWSANVSTNASICDNSDCHATNTTIYPFSSRLPNHANGVVNTTAGANCAACHTHKSSSGGWTAGEEACGTCHGYPPSSSDPLPDSSPAAVGVHKVHATDLSYKCDKCHTGGSHNESNWVGNGSGYAISSTNVDVGFANFQNATAASYNSTSDTCSNVMCHNPDSSIIGITGRNSTSPAIAVTWAANYTSAPYAITTCKGCHADSGVGNVHRIHEATNGNGGYNFDCRVCHSTFNAATNNYPPVHGNGVMNSTATDRVSINLTNASAFVGLGLNNGTFDAGTKTCSSVYCHGNYVGNTPFTPNWTNASTGNCGTCHSSTSLTTGAHLTHTNDTTYNIGCKTCHYTVTINNTAIASLTLHVDAKAAIAFDTTDARNDTIDAYTANNDTIGAPYGTCTNLYCHGYYAGNNTVTAVIPNWGDPATGDCGDCHSVTNAQFKHDRHVNTTLYNIACVTCHYTVATSNITVFNLSAYGTRHIDGNVDVDFDPTNPKNNTTTSYSRQNGVLSNNVTTLPTPGTCANTYCHSTGAQVTPWTNTSINWSVTGTCASCHVANPATGSHTQHLNTSIGGGNVCGDCHTAGTDMTNHVNQIKTIKAGLTYNTTTLSCGVNLCHNNGKNAASKTPAYAWGTSIGGLNSCTECHNNASAPLMDTESHNEHVGASTKFGININCSSCHFSENLTTHGNGVVNLTITNVTYTGGTVVGDTTFGTCGTNNCHRADASANTAPIVPVYPWGATLGDCVTCHAAPPNTNKHANHFGSNWLNGTDLNECYFCHTNTATSGGLATGASHINAVDNVNFNAVVNYENTSASVASGTDGTTTCSNVKCHNGVTTPQWSAAITCGQCHNTSGTGPLPGAASIIGQHDQSHANNDTV
ncbi:CxxxxCH/CxxCH domain-containing protein, partial [bacterium]